MQKIIYYVAISLDGFISGENGDISRFVAQGEGVAKYLADLAQFKTVIMGKNTYEFGYRFGLVPGQPAYPHMQHHIFSRTLELEYRSDQVSIEPISIERVKVIRDKSPTDVYCCGGGQFAGWLLKHGLIDRLKLKVNPMVLGSGVKLFGASTSAANWQVVKAESFSDGIHMLTYDKKES